MDIKFRSTNLGTLQSCPMKFALEQLLPKEKWAEGLALGVGSSIHAYCEKYKLEKELNRYTEEEIRDLSLFELFKVYPFRKHDQKDYNRSLPHVLSVLDKLHESGFFDNEIVYHNNKPMIEYKFKINLKTPFKNNYTITGVLDAVYKINGKITPVDYKTSTKGDNAELAKWQNRKQFKLYTLVLKHILNTEEELPMHLVSVEMVNSESNIEFVDIPFNKKAHDEYKRYLGWKVYQTELMLNTVYFPREDACHTNYGACKFARWCHQFENLIDTYHMIFKERVTPEDTDEDQEVDFEFNLDLTKEIDFILSKSGGKKNE